jgi:hypothetical protein
MTDENVRLLNFQLQLEKEDESRTPFFGLSVNETIRTCLLNGLGKRAEKVKADFKVSDKRYIPFISLPSTISKYRLAPAQILVHQAASIDCNARFRRP